jgi:hypothetical protein
VKDLYRIVIYGYNKTGILIDGVLRRGFSHASINRLPEIMIDFQDDAAGFNDYKYRVEYDYGIVCGVFAYYHEIAAICDNVHSLILAGDSCLNLSDRLKNYSGGRPIFTMPCLRTNPNAAVFGRPDKKPPELQDFIDLLNPSDNPPWNIKTMDFITAESLHRYLGLYRITAAALNSDLKTAAAVDGADWKEIQAAAYLMLKDSNPFRASYTDIGVLKDTVDRISRGASDKPALFILQDLVKKMSVEAV